MKWVTPLMASGATQTASEGTCMLQAHSAEACMTTVVEMCIITPIHNDVTVHK